MAEGGQLTSETDIPQSKKIDGCYVLPESWNFVIPNASGLMKYLFLEKNETGIPSLSEELDKELPVTTLNSEEVKDAPAEGKIRVTWLGHASVLVQMDGISVLTDPVFSQRCGPRGLRSFGPRRYRRCPCDVNQLPDIDAVVISHSHYDHLDVNTVRDLNKRFGDKLTWFVPSDMKCWMTATGCQNVHELAWWQEETLQKRKDIKFVCVPAQHWSNRGITDRNTILWGGWCIIGPSSKFYYTGDTGYNKFVFTMIRQRFGRFDLAAIPIGAYAPRWFMKHQHVDPDEAFQIHKEIEAYNTIGIHWGTFKLSNEPYLEPRQRIEKLQAENSRQEPDNNRLGFFTMNPGVSQLLFGWPK